MALPLRVVHVVTAAESLCLMRGQIGYLQRQGWQVTVIASPGPELEAARDQGVEVCAIPMAREIRPWRDLVALGRMWLAIRSRRPDIVNAGTPKAGLIASVAGLMARVPHRVYTLRGLRLETARGLKRGLLLGTEKIACLCSHRVICVSQSLRSRVLELGIAPASKCVVLAAGSSNGVDGDAFAPSPSRSQRGRALRARLGIPDRTPVIGYVGRFTRDKGIEELLTAYRIVRRRIPEVRLLLIGNYDSGDPISSPTRTALLTDESIIRTGFVPESGDYYEIMDLLALPSHREGFPNVVLEAQASAKPVVTTVATGCRDAVVDGVTGILVPVGDASALADAFISILEDAALAARLGSAGRRRVIAQFRRETMWAELAACYFELVRSPRQQSTRQSASTWKRIIDCIGSSLALLILMPVLALLGILIRCTLGSPVLFRQPRAGLNGTPFVLFKFRTMFDDRDSSGTVLPDAQRLRALGRFLRRTSLDELPEFWNVLRGDMSLVGPRPLLTRYLDRYTPEQMRRHHVLPGITGWAQVRGRNALSWDEKFELDLWYVDHRSFWLDLRILFETMIAVFRRHGISQPGQATMEEFMGSSPPKSSGKTASSR